MIPDSALIFTFILSALLLTLAPGPDIVYVAMRGLAQGWRAGLVAALGLITGIFVHITLAALGLSAVLASSPVLFAMVKYAGAAYILYVGWQIAKSGPVKMEEAAATPRFTLSHIYRQTVLMNIMNPKVALFFLAFLPQFIDATKGHVTAQFIFFGVLFQLSALVVMASVGLFAGSIASLFRSKAGDGRWMNRIAGGGVMLIGAAIPAKELWAFLSETYSN
ncbi:MAG: LysE family translocator [Alphaproteobacteria bacterium]|nr:MAG: LysE family translocator [Alphaproteobacteria bacterium]